MKLYLNKSKLYRRRRRVQAQRKKFNGPTFRGSNFSTHSWNKFGPVSSIPASTFARLKYATTVVGATVDQTTPFSSTQIRGNCPQTPISIGSSIPNNIEHYQDYYAYQYTYAAKIIVRFDWSNNSGTTNPLTGIRWGVTAACVNGGTGVPGMDSGQYLNWPDSNYTKSSVYNYFANSKDNTLEMYMPTSVFQDTQGNQEWGSQVNTTPFRMWYFVLWCYSDQTTANYSFIPNFNVEIVYYTKYTLPLDSNVVLVE